MTTSTTSCMDGHGATLTIDEAAGQSLARGAAGTALLHVERARTGSGDWRTVRAHIRPVIASRIDTAEHVGLFHGAPANRVPAAHRRPPSHFHAAVRTIDEHA